MTSHSPGYVVLGLLPFTATEYTFTTHTMATNGTITPSPDENETLFSPKLISPNVTSALPDGYSMRPLQRNDYSNTFLDVLRVLTQVGEVTREEFELRFEQMKASSGGYHILVILDGKGKIVGTGALIVERKLLVVPPPSCV